MDRLNRARGYSVIELLVVLFIIGILALVGIGQIGDRRASSVRTLVNQVDGILMQAQKASMSTGRDIMLSVNGTWTTVGEPSLAGSSPLVIDGRPFDPAILAPVATSPRIGSDADRFVSRYSQKAKDHLYAAVATNADANDAVADLAALPPFSTNADFLAAFNNRLSTGDAKNVIVSGNTKRFLEGFSIAIVSIEGGTGNVWSSGPMALIVVPANSAATHRFYKAADGNGWRRI